jgi:sugar lactone lactonase YvrE
MGETGALPGVRTAGGARRRLQGSTGEPDVSAGTTWHEEPIQHTDLRAIDGRPVERDCVASFLVTLALCFGLACGGDTGGQDTATDSGGGSTSDDDEPDDGGAGTGDDDDDVTDCGALPPLPASYTRLDFVPGSEDFTFDAEGHLVCVTVEGSDLVRVPYGGPVELVVPDVGRGGFGDWLRGTRFLLDGDLAVADPAARSIRRVGLDGEISILAGNVTGPNGIAVGMDGFVHVAQLEGAILRLDPASGEAAPLFTSETGQRFDGITFGPGYEILYFDEEQGGAVHQVAMAPDGTAGPPSLLATIPSEGDPMGGALDGMAADECGNVYVVAMSGLVYRVTPDGQPEVAVDVRPSLGSGGTGGASSIMAVNFGSGVGGWKERSLYIMSTQGGFFEADLGVRGKPEPHLP